NICGQGIGAYHAESTAQNMTVAYAVLPQCPDTGYLDVIGNASHEFNEAATDPRPSSNPAFFGFDDDHLAYEFFNDTQDELGDACEFYPSPFYMDDESEQFNFLVQRQWSNQSAAAGHNPCVPAARTPYFNMTVFPEQLDSFMVDMRMIGYGRVQTKGFKAV